MFGMCVTHGSGPQGCTCHMARSRSWPHVNINGSGPRGHTCHMSNAAWPHVPHVQGHMASHATYSEPHGLTCQMASRATWPHVPHVQGHMASRAKCSEPHGLTCHMFRATCPHVPHAQEHMASRATCSESHGRTCLIAPRATWPWHIAMRAPCQSVPRVRARPPCGMFHMLAASGIGVALVQPPPSLSFMQPMQLPSHGLVK